MWKVVSIADALGVQMGSIEPTLDVDDCLCVITNRKRVLAIVY